jgi:hypothetical protein
MALAACTGAPGAATAPPATQGDGQIVKPHATAPYLLHVKCPHVPDPPPGEVPPAPPGPPQVLQPGHWEWVDGTYAWTPPEWHPRPPGPSRAWQDGYWEANGGACVWHNGRLLPAALP